jgi:hypothetical protein
MRPHLDPERLRVIAARPCTCNQCPPGVGCAPCWARDKLYGGRRLCAHADLNGDGAHWLEPGERCPLLIDGAES